MTTQPTDTSTVDVPVADRWLDAAACAGRPEAFDVDTDDVAAPSALAICTTCPVLEDCRRYALSHDVSGVCGGLTRTQRVRLQEAHVARLSGSAQFLPTDVVAIDEFDLTGHRRRGHGTAANRARHVAMLADRGYPASQIADVMGLTVRSVNRLLEIAVHHLGIELGPASVISVLPVAPRSIAGRGVTRQLEPGLLIAAEGTVAPSAA
jgi:hypothetical protein